MMTRASLVAMAVLFLYGSPAHALTRVAPPGNSGASQYQEDVPSAGGGVPVTNLPSTTIAPQVLPPSVVTQLDHSGTTGRAVAALANRTAPVAVGVNGSHSGAGAPATPNEGRASSPASQIEDAVVVGGGGGLGLLLPLALAGSLIVAVAVAIVLARRNRTR